MWNLINYESSVPSLLSFFSSFLLTTLKPYRLPTATKTPSSSSDPGQRAITCQSRLSFSSPSAPSPFPRPIIPRPKAHPTFLFLFAVPSSYSPGPASFLPNTTTGLDLVPTGGSSFSKFFFQKHRATTV